MTSQQVVSNEYDARMRRADKLIAEKSSASELLFFYKRIASFQKNFFAQISEAGKQQLEIPHFNSLREGLDIALVLPEFRTFLSLVEQNAPNALAATAREIAGGRHRSKRSPPGRCRGWSRCAAADRPAPHQASPAPAPGRQRPSPARAPCGDAPREWFSAAPRRTSAIGLGLRRELLSSGRCTRR